MLQPPSARAEKQSAAHGSALASLAPMQRRRRRPRRSAPRSAWSSEVSCAAAGGPKWVGKAPSQYVVRAPSCVVPRPKPAKLPPVGLSTARDPVLLSPRTGTVASRGRCRRAHGAWHLGSARPLLGVRWACRGDHAGSERALQGRGLRRGGRLRGCRLKGSLSPMCAQRLGRGVVTVFLSSEYRLWVPTTRLHARRCASCTASAQARGTFEA